MKKTTKKNFVFAVPRYRVGELVAVKRDKDFWEQKAITYAQWFPKSTKLWMYCMPIEKWNPEKEKLEQWGRWYSERDLKKI